MNQIIYILCILNGISITFIYHIINKNCLDDINNINKKYNKQLLIIFLLCTLGTYICFYVHENKLLNNIITDSNIEINSGEPNF